MLQCTLTGGTRLGVTGVIDERILGLQCNLCVNASVNTDWGYKARGYRGY